MFRLQTQLSRGRWINARFVRPFSTIEDAREYACMLDPDGFIPPNAFRVVDEAGSIIKL